MPYPKERYGDNPWFEMTISRSWSDDFLEDHYDIELELVYDEEQGMMRPALKYKRM